MVNQGGGTGGGARVAGLDIAGKTGTAQVVSVALQHSAHSANYKNNAWFVGYSPSSNPDIVVSVLLMHGGESSVAAPVAGAVIKAYYEEYHPQDLHPSSVPKQMTTRDTLGKPQGQAVKSSVFP